MRYVIAFCVMACLIVGLTYRTSAADQSLEELIARVNTIEKATLKNLMHPGQTHAARIEKLEKIMDQQSQSDTSLEKRISGLERELNQISRQVNDLQKQITARSPDPSIREIRELQRLIEAQQRELKDLSSRVRRLESSK